MAEVFLPCRKVKFSFGFTLAEVFSPCRKVNFSFGFTLAEVLITLGIIGVVAAITLPTLIQNSQRRELQVGLKKGYSTISQALDMYYAENGERITARNMKKQQLQLILMKYLSYTENCGPRYEDFMKKCLPNAASDYKNYPNSYRIYYNYFDDGIFTTKDGNLILLENANVVNNGVMELFISVDVNGYRKRPNRIGYDLFMFQVDENGKLQPMGAEGTKFYDVNNKYCSKNIYGPESGLGCTYKALTDKDYFKNLPK